MLNSLTVSFLRMFLKVFFFLLRLPDLVPLYPPVEVLQLRAVTVTGGALPTITLDGFVIPTIDIGNYFALQLEFETTGNSSMYTHIALVSGKTGLDFKILFPVLPLSSRMNRYDLSCDARKPVFGVSDQV